jgi:hypothetical protein
MYLKEEMQKYRSIFLNEAWDKKMNTPDSKKGMFKGKTKAELRSELAAAKKRSQKCKDDGKKEPQALKTKIKELQFALRAKNKFGNVTEAKNCGMCGKPVKLSPSAEARAKKHGGTAKEYTDTFPNHAECELANRKKLSSETAKKHRDGKLAEGFNDIIDLESPVDSFPVTSPSSPVTSEISDGDLVRYKDEPESLMVSKCDGKKYVGMAMDSLV